MITVFVAGIATAARLLAGTLEWGNSAKFAPPDIWHPFLQAALVVVAASILVVITWCAARRRNGRVTTTSGRNEKSLQIILDSTADGIVTIDETGTIESFNRAAELSFGWTAEEVVGRNVSILTPEPHCSRHDEYIAAYLKTGTARILGKLRDVSAQRKDGSPFPVELSVSEFEHEGRRSFTAVLRDITHRRQAKERIHKLAFYDSLTGLPNRRLLRDQLQRASEAAKRDARSLAVLFIDIDRFKQMNDTIGSSSGDRLIAMVAERLMDSLRLVDYVARVDQGDQDMEGDASGDVARLGGDEFAVILSNISQPGDAAKVAGRIRNAISAPVLLDGRELFVTVSIGIALYPNVAEDADALLRCADVAMRHARGAGGNTFRFYSERMNADRSRRLRLESRLRGALRRKELSLLYQPIFDAVSRHVVGAEALLRWNDSQFGEVSPVEFIPILEDTGLIVPVGEWVLETSAATVRGWRQAGYGEIRLSVNVSVVQIRRSDIRDAVSRALTKAGLSPDALVLEITESTMLEVDEAQFGALRELRAMGVGIALDDFGTGYSSLSLLRSVPIERVKIDRSFVAELTVNGDDRALVSAIIAMAHGLRLKVVAEGVERELQEQFLCAQGCDEVQGYLMGRPVCAEAFERYLNPGAPSGGGNLVGACDRCPASAPGREARGRMSREE